jgi:ferredoxin
MFDRLLNFIVKATNIQPRYTPEHCLVVKKVVGGCTLCQDACPHDAIAIDREVHIDDIDCTGCGLCIQACPSEALEAKVSYQSGAPLRCSQVKGGAQSVQCFARLEPSDILRLGGGRGKVTLARGDCASCPIGSFHVLKAMDNLVAEARTLAGVLGRELEVNILETESFDATDNPDALSRREFLQGGVRSLQGRVGEALAPLDPGDDDEKTPLPIELRKRYQLLKMAKPQVQEKVPWILPRVLEGCIMCPVCTNVCPTGAFQREFPPPGEGGEAKLRLEPERCNGCNACVRSCPVNVITLEDEVTWGELSGGPSTAYVKPSGQGKDTSIPRD